MNITIDSGNTLTKIGFFEDEKLLNIISVKDLYQVLDLLPTDTNANVIFASVNQSITPIIERLKKYRKLIELNYLTSLPLKNAYHSPETLGMDRLAAAVGARQFFKKGPCLIIDAGSCITFDLVDDNDTYKGGSISPGIGIRFKALHAFTAKLPMVDFTDFKDQNLIELVGKNTKDSILSGVVNGMIAEIKGIIQDYRAIYPDIHILICGGDANYFESRIKQSIFAIPELIHWGLNRILAHNESEF